MSASFVNGIAWLEEQFGILDKTRPIRVPYIPSPDWSKGLVYQEDVFSHNVSKIVGAGGVEFLGGLWINKLGLLRVVAPNNIWIAKGTASDAITNVGRVDHAGRHLSDFGVIAGKQGSPAFRDAVRSVVIDILENPIKKFDHVMAQGGQAVKGYYGKINGKDVVIFVAKEARGKINAGDLVTAITPTPQQMINWGLK